MATAKPETSERSHSDEIAGDISVDGGGKTLATTRREKILKMENITNEEYNNLAVKEKVRLMKKVMGRPVSPEPFRKLNDEILTEGAIVVYQTFLKVVILLPDGSTKKWAQGDSGRATLLRELEALVIANEGGLLAPRVHGSGLGRSQKSQDKSWIAMDTVPGRPLENVWKDLSRSEKTLIAQQLGAFMAKKRAMTRPGCSNHIGGPREGQPGREIRQYNDYEIAACQDEAAFNRYLLDSLFPNTPRPVRDALASSLRTDHHIIFTHGDFALRNIMVQDGHVTGIVDWENAGWFPEYWEYVKFFHQNFANDDFRDYADIIFPQSFPNELIVYTALAKYQYP